MKEKINKIIKELESLKKEIPTTYKVGDKYHFSGMDWYVMEVKDNQLVLILDDVLPESILKKYFTDEIMVDRDGVRHQDNIRPYSWDKSYIRQVLNDKFLKDNFCIEQMVKMDEDWIRLPKKEEIGTNDMFEATKSYWTMTGYLDTSYSVWFVYTNYGNLFDRNAYNASGVRPVITIKKEGNL